MQTTSLFRRAAALALTLVLAVSASLAGFAAYAAAASPLLRRLSRQLRQRT